MSQLYSYSDLSFTCSRCEEEFVGAAYSMARNRKELNRYRIYCDSCAEAVEEKYAEIDGRSLNKSGRIYQLGTRVRKEFLVKLKRIAKEEGLKLVEVLERSLELYDEGRGKNS